MLPLWYLCGTFEEPLMQPANPNVSLLQIYVKFTHTQNSSSVIYLSQKICF